MPQIEIKNAAGEIVVCGDAESVKVLIVNAIAAGHPLVGAILNDADLRYVDFGSADLSNASFDRAWLIGADFSRATTTGATFAGADLTGSLPQDRWSVASKSKAAKVVDVVYDAE